MNQLKQINDLLNMKTEESTKREEKIDILQKQIENYVREINSLKEDAKIKLGLIKELKYELFRYCADSMKHAGGR